MRRARVRARVAGHTTQKPTPLSPSFLPLSLPSSTPPAKFLSMVSVCVGVVSAIGSVFGQNLYFSSRVTPLAAWHAATWGSVGVAAAAMGALLAYARRHNLLFIPTPDE